MDGKSRVAVPAKLIPALRALVGAGEEDKIEVVITVTAQQRLGVYPRHIFMNKIKALEQAPPSDREAEELRITLYNNMDEQCLDKQNRFRIPAAYAHAFKLSGEVIVTGSGSFLEVVNKDQWQEQLISRMADLPEKEKAAGKYLDASRGAGAQQEQQEEQP